MDGTAYSRIWEAVIFDIDKVCLQYDLKWRRRYRIIDTKLIVTFLFQLVLGRGDDGYATTLFELWSGIKGKGEKPKKVTPVSASSMCEARQKLDEDVFKDIIRRIAEEYEKFVPFSDRSWNNRRVFAVDGSKIMLPPELFSQGFDLQGVDSRSPMGLASCLFDLKTKIPCDFSLAAHADERLLAMSHLPYLSKNDCVIYDRGYFGYGLLYEHAERSVDAVFRLAGGGTFHEIKEFMDDPQHPSERIVKLFPRKSSRCIIRKSYKEIEFRPIELRLIRYEIDGNQYFLGTTIMDPQITNEHFKDLYHARWGVEEFYKIAKSHLKVENFHSKTPRGVKQELYASFVLAALTRIVSMAAQSLTSSENETQKPVRKKRMKASHLKRQALQKNRDLFI
jgi:hypothetical protein